MQNRVNGILQDEQKRASQIQQQKQKVDEEAAFKQKHNMSDEAFNAFKEKASSHIMTLDDINYIVNKDIIKFLNELLKNGGYAPSSFNINLGTANTFTLLKSHASAKFT